MFGGLKHNYRHFRGTQKLLGVLYGKCLFCALILFKITPTTTCLLHIYFLEPKIASQDNVVTVIGFILSQCFLHKHSSNESNKYLPLSVNTLLIITSPLNITPNNRNGW